MNVFIPLWYLKRPKNFGRSVCLFRVRFCRGRGRERVYRVREGESESGGEVRESLWEAESDSFINYRNCKK